MARFKDLPVGTTTEVTRQVVFQVPCAVPARLSDNTLTRIFKKLLQIGQADASETAAEHEITSPDADEASTIVFGTPTLAPTDLRLWYMHASDEDGVNRDLLIWALSSEDAEANWRTYFDISEMTSGQIQWARTVPLEPRPGAIRWDELGDSVDSATDRPAPRG